MEWPHQFNMSLLLFLVLLLSVVLVVGRSCCRSFLSFLLRSFLLRASSLRPFHVCSCDRLVVTLAEGFMGWCHVWWLRYSHGVSHQPLVRLLEEMDSFFGACPLLVESLCTSSCNLILVVRVHRESRTRSDGSRE